MPTYITRYGELWLKGLNRRFFENKLFENLRNTLVTSSINLIDIIRGNGYLVLNTDKDAVSALKHVFGIASFSSVTVCNLDISEICKTAVEIAAECSFASFCVRAKRMNKDFSYNSLEIERIVGERIQKETNTKVNLKKPELTLLVEIGKKAYLSAKKINGAGGLPVGTSANVLSVVTEKSDLVSTWLVMKRGCTPVLLLKKDIDYSELERYSSGRMIVTETSDTEMKKLIAEYKPVAAVGGSLSTDLDSLPVLRPLTGLSSEEIEQIGKNAGIY